MRELLRRAQTEPAIAAEGIFALFRGAPEDPEAIDMGQVGAFVIACALCAR
jgi:hypothetical protein